VCENAGDGDARIAERESNTMKLCHAPDRTELIHAVTPSDDNPAGQTLCGLPVKIYLPFLPVDSFGKTNDMDWCRDCVREKRYQELPPGCRWITKKLTAEVRRKAVDLHDQVLSVKQIMGELGIGKSSAYKALKEAGVIRKRGIRRMFAIHEYRKRHSAKETSQHFGITVRSVHFAVRTVSEKLGIKRGANGQYNLRVKAGVTNG
jgi:DNA-binding transcriptional regulator YhcF (GntR family)